MTPASGHDALPQNPPVPDRPRFASIGSPYFGIMLAIMAVVLILSNIGASKGVAIGPIITDGGFFLFPLAYILGDVISEVYGFKAARKAIVLAFAMSALAALTFWLVQLAPPADGWGNQEAFESVLGFVPRIVLASIAGFLVGQLLNSYVLVAIKRRTQEKALWLRLLGSTVIGEFADTAIFCTIAFYGVITGGEFLTYVIIGFAYKTIVEIVLMPVTYRIIAAVKRREPTYAPVDA